MPSSVCLAFAVVRLRSLAYAGINEQLGGTLLEWHFRACAAG